MLAYQLEKKQFFDGLVTYMKRKNIDKLPVDKFNDRQREIVLSLINTMFLIMTVNIFGLGNDNGKTYRLKQHD